MHFHSTKLRKMNYTLHKKLYLQPRNEKFSTSDAAGETFAKFAAENYSVKVLRASLFQRNRRNSGKRYPELPVEIKLMGYRDLKDKFDRIDTIGMFEHTGSKVQAFMQVVQRFK